MTADELEVRIVDWARGRRDIQALVLAGSRAKAGCNDRFSDWDFHLVADDPRPYFDTEWLSEIAPVWCKYSEVTPRGVIKISVVFAGGWEADFIPLTAWQMKLVYWAMRHPSLQSVMPARLLRGIAETRAFLLGSGFVVLLGGASWRNRLQAVMIEWPAAAMSEEEFAEHEAAFWQKSVWVMKKIARPEPRSAMHWLHQLVINHVYALLAEEARIAGRTPRTEARKAEYWLDTDRLEQTNITTSLDREVLARALLDQMTLVDRVGQSIATTRGFARKDYAEVANWVRGELGKFI